MTTYLISGGNRGLGLEFVRQYAQQGVRVIVGARAPERAEALNRLASDRSSGIVVHQLDVADPGSVAAFREAVGEQPIDAVIANAGVMPERQGFGQIDYAAWIRAMEINAFGPVRLAEALVENLREGGGKKMIAVSSMLGSMGANTVGGYLTYRATKAALNSAWKTLSVGLKADGIACVLLHPGYVRTDMGGPGADIAPDESVAGMRRVIAGLGPADTGRFITWRGEDYPW